MPECGGVAEVLAAAAGMAANPMDVVLRIRNNLRPPFPVGKPNRSRPLRRPGTAGTKPKAPNGGATYVARGKATCGAAGRRHPGKTRKTDHPLLRSPEEGQGVEAGPWTRCGIWWRRRREPYRRPNSAASDPFPPSTPRLRHAATPTPQMQRDAARGVAWSRMVRCLIAHCAPPQLR